MNGPKLDKFETIYEILTIEQFIKLRFFLGLAFIQNVFLIIQE